MLTKFSSAAALIVTALPLIAGCVSGGGYKPVSERLPALEVSFAEPAWNGNTIPAGQHCQMFGGKGQTPALKVGKIPAGANAIIVEFNDLSFGPLSSGGGHGKIGYWLKGAGSAVLSSVPGETADLGVEGSFIEARALSTGAICFTGLPSPLFRWSWPHLRGRREGCIQGDQARRGEPVACRTADQAGHILTGTTTAAPGQRMVGLRQVAVSLWGVLVLELANLRLRARFMCEMTSGRLVSACEASCGGAARGVARRPVRQGGG